MGVAVSGVFVAGGLIAAVSRRSSVHEPETNRSFSLLLFDFYPAFFFFLTFSLKKMTINVNF